VSLRDAYGAIENQGDEGSCSAFSSLQFRAALRKQAGLPFIDPSEQGQYFMERCLERTVNQDSGGTLEDALFILEKLGVLPSQDDPYTDTDFTVEPPINKFDKSLRLNQDQVQKLNQGTLLADTLDALANRHPILFGFLVFQELESPEVASTGLLPMPGQGSANLGGHAVNAIGFDPVNERILVLNQWGQDWGIHDPAEFAGCFWMPYAYFEKFVTDAYVGFPDKK
jgi:C1A family cysteine protease